MNVRQTPLRTVTVAMVATVTVSLSGCATGQFEAQQSDAQLRRTVSQLRSELDEVRQDQERLRAQVEHLQYASGSRGPTGNGVAPGPPARSESGWPTTRHGSDSSQTYGAADDRDSVAAVTASGTGESAAASPPTRGTVMGRGEAPPGAVPITDGTEETQAGIVAGVRGGGSWNQPGGLGGEDVPTVPASLRGTGYDDGVRAYLQQQWEDSIQYFRTFVHESPTSPYADDAQYWIGDCYLQRGLYSNAIKEFNQVVLRYGSGDRAPAALLKLSQVFSKIGDQVDARLSLQKLVNRYPGSAESAQAYRLLQEMGG
jgi:tol-pal system protein YbgF